MDEDDEEERRTQLGVLKVLSDSSHIAFCYSSFCVTLLCWVLVSVLCSLFLLVPPSLWTGSGTSELGRDKAGGVMCRSLGPALS